LRLHTDSFRIRGWLLLSLISLIAAMPHSAFSMLPCYHTRAAIDTFLIALEHDDSSRNIVHIDTIGYSRGESLGESYPIYAIKISDNADIDEDEPASLIIGHIHGEEVVGLELTLSYIWRITHQYLSFLELINNTEMYFIPTMNPDGLEIVSRDLDDSYRKNGYVPPGLNGRPCVVTGTGSDWCGVDLNRNFGVNWIYGDTLWQPGGQEPFDYYRGPAPFSEPETQAIRDFATLIKPAVSIVYHSSRTGNFSEMGITAWKWGDDPGPYKFSPDCTAIGRLNGQYCVLLPKSGTTGSTYQPNFGGTRNGCLQDWFYWKLGTIQILTELGPPTQVQPSCSTMQRLTTVQFYSSINWINGRPYNVRREGPTPMVIHTRDASTQQPISAEWRILDTWSSMLAPWYTDEQYGSAHTLLASQGWVHIMARKDGYATKTDSVVINPNSVLQGITLYLQPLPRHQVQIVLYDESHNAIAGRVWADNGFPKWIDVPAGTGANAELPEGTYHFIAVPDDPQRMVLWHDVYVGGNDTIVFEAQQAAQRFYEDFASGLGNWTTGGNANPWRLEADTTAFAYGNGLVFTPTGYREQYASNLNAWISASTAIDLNGGNAAYLEFDRRGRLEMPYDSLYVEASTDGGTNWEIAARFCDWELPWTPAYVNLLQWIPNSIRLRFRIVTDATLGDLGLTIDNVHVWTGTDLAVPSQPEGIAYTYRIHGSYPNPFNSATTINYEVASVGAVTLTIYNILGEEVRRFNERPVSAGLQKLVWDGTAQNGGILSSGLYFVQLQAVNVRITHKLLLLR